MNDWDFNIAPWKLLKHTLDHTTASLVFAEKKYLVLNEWDNELDLTGRKVEYDALNDVVSFFAEHHLNQQFLIKLSNYLLLLFKR